MYGRKNILFTCVCLGFPRENFYTGSRLGGGVVTCGSPPRPFWYILQRFWNSRGFLSVFNHPKLHTFYVRAGQPFRRHPQGFPSVLWPLRFILFTCVCVFLMFMGQLEIIGPLFFILFMFSIHQSCLTRKNMILFLLVPSLRKQLLAPKNRPATCQAAKKYRTQISIYGPNYR